jgi:hypothetical protein
MEGLFGGDESLPQHLLNQRVIFGEEGEGMAAIEVDSAISHMGIGEEVILDEGDSDGGAKLLILGVLLGYLKEAVLGGLDGFFKQLGRISCWSLQKILENRLSGYASGHLSRRFPTHAITYNPHIPMRRLPMIGIVFVFGANPPRMRNQRHLYHSLRKG